MGRFKKGETPPGAKPFSEETAKEMQRRSIEAHYRNKRGQELVRALLESAVTDPDVLAYAKARGFTQEEITNELALHTRQIEKAQKTGDTKAYNAVMKAAGYDSVNINIPEGMVIRVDNEDQAHRLETLGD